MSNNTKLKPEALSQNWGGMLCIELGNTKPDNFDYIYSALENAFTEHKFIDIKVYDSVSLAYFGDCETFWKSSSGYYGIRQIGVASGTSLNVREYRFYDDGRYERKTTTLGGVIKEPNTLTTDEQVALYDYISACIANSVDVQLIIDRDTYQLPLSYVAQRDATHIELHTTRVLYDSGKMQITRYIVSATGSTTRTLKEISLGGVLVKAPNIMTTDEVIELYNIVDTAINNDLYLDIAIKFDADRAIQKVSFAIKLDNVIELRTSRFNISKNNMLCQVFDIYPNGTVTGTSRVYGLS